MRVDFEAIIARDRKKELGNEVYQVLEKTFRSRETIAGLIEEFLTTKQMGDFLKRYKKGMGTKAVSELVFEVCPDEERIVYV